MHNGATRGEALQKTGRGGAKGKRDNARMVKQHANNTLWHVGRAKWT